MLIEVEQIQSPVVQEALDVLGLEGGDEERGIQLALLQGRGCDGDVLPDQRGPWIPRGGTGLDQAVGGEHPHGDGVSAAALPADTDPQRDQKIADAIALILQQTVAQSSPYVLEKPPISSTIKVAVTAAVENPAACSATCDADSCADVPRSRENGFDYDGATNSISFFSCLKTGEVYKQAGFPFSFILKLRIDLHRR